MVDRTISLKAAIDAIHQICNDDCYHIGHEGRCYKDCGLNKARKALEELPSAQPESFEDERKKIADALSDKMAYMNTCLNERDIILGIVGVERPSENHCNSDCWNEKCASYHYATKTLLSAQPSISCHHENDMVSREAVFDELDAWEKDLKEICHHETAADLKLIRQSMEALPSAQPELEETILKIGYTGKEGLIHIHGRLFAVRELPQ